MIEINYPNEHTYTYICRCKNCGIRFLYSRLRHYRAAYEDALWDLEHISHDWGT